MALLSAEIETKKLVPLCRQLATAYEAGIPILRTLETVSATSRDAKIKRVLQSMADDLRQGSTLGEAADRQSKFLSPFFRHLLASGEHGGHLDVMLKDLAAYYEDRLAMQRQITSMLAVPVLQLVACWFLGTFAMGILGVEGLDGVMTYFREYVAFQIRAMGGFCVLGAVTIFLSRMGVLGWITGAVTTHVWPISTVTKKFGLARFFRSLSLLLESGLSITKCIENAAAVTSNPYMERDLVKTIPLIRSGASLTEAFSHTRYLTPLAHQMLTVGEESGKLDFQLKKLAEYHLDEANHAVRVATQVFGTLIILGVGLLIGYIIVSFYQQLYGGMFDELGV